MHNCKAQFVTYPSIGNNNAGLSDYSLFQVGKIGYNESTEHDMEYRIQEVSEKLQVKRSTIRYWETEFSDLVKPKRTNGGQRRYSEEDIDNLRQIKNILYRKNRTIAQARNILRRGNADKDSDYPGFRGRLRYPPRDAEMQRLLNQLLWCPVSRSHPNKTAIYPDLK